MFLDASQDSMAPDRDSLAGLAIATSIVGLWCLSLFGLFILDVAQAAPAWVVIGVLLRTFLHTGLFIITHEAIHGTLSQYQGLNSAIGRTTAFLYALLSFPILAKNHRLHHLYPGTHRDPDFCAPGSKHFGAWYLKFMGRYQEDGQAWISLIGMTFVFVLFAGVPIPLANIFLFWVLPILMSSLQLFTFGIFLPHRPRNQGYCDRHRASSTTFPAFWSFIACYHFGYHLEHHRYPHLPWYKLPQANRMPTQPEAKARLV